MLMTTLMGGAMSVVLFSAYKSFPDEIQGLQYWAGGLLLLVTAAILFALRHGPLPREIAVLGANCFLIWGVGLSMIGTQKFYGRKPSWWLIHLIWVAGMAGMVYWLLVRPSFAFRIASYSLLVSTFYATQVVLIYRHGERHFSTWFFGLLMTMQTLVVMTRGVLALASGNGHGDLMQPGPFQSIYLATGNFMALLLTVGFMTVATRRLQTILERRSTLDPLTQVLNRRGFADVYARERALLRREGGQMTMLSIDLDFFKLINDRHGHATGDRVLIDVAKVIGKVLRGSDHLARFGGEEFVVLLPDAGEELACNVAERIQLALRLPRVPSAEASPPSAKNRPPALPAYTVSIGIATQNDANEDLDGILMRADKALYSAKEHGRDRIEVAEHAGPLLRAVSAPGSA
jgi:diguanylate cyclase (GGDEF)-like protein